MAARSSGSRLGDGRRHKIDHRPPVTITPRGPRSSRLNQICLQSVNVPLPFLGMEGSMDIYPVPATVTHARVQLVADQTTKAPPRTINEDVLDVLATENQAEREAVLDVKA